MALAFMYAVILSDPVKPMLFSKVKVKTLQRSPALFGTLKVVDELSY